ncbi:MAG: class II aldolase/adducin family protein [Deltaproteobacteria bacterium]|nr:class II aldolase/adducin family protein [Deltaproteobacteria bacterium]
MVDFEKVVSQSTVHQAIYKARQEIGAVIHFHSPYVILLIIVGQTIRPMHNYSAIFYEGVPLFEATGQVETPERAGKIAQLLGPAKVILLRGHGAIVVGRSIPEVCILSLYLEESVRLQVEAMKLGDAQYLSQEEAERISHRTFKPESTLRAWEHFKRKAGA